MPCSNEPCDENRPHPDGAESGAQAWPSLVSLTSQAFQLRCHQHHALHPVEAALQYHRASAEISGEEGHGGRGFEEAEAHYRAGAQGLRLSEIPQLPQQLRELSRLSSVDRAGRSALRKWAQEQDLVFEETCFFECWEIQGKRGGVEHQVYYDAETGRGYKRRYRGVNSSTLGDYLGRMRLHAVLFPETGYRLVALRDNPKTDQVTDQVSDQVAALLLALGTKTLSALECMKRLKLSNRPTFRANYLNLALSAGLIERTIPDKPNSRLQKYRVVR